MTTLTSLGVRKDGADNGTTPAGHRQAIAGTLFNDGNGPRLGVLADSMDTVVSGTGAMSYSVRACRVATALSGSDGAMIGAVTATETVATTAAPGSGSRYDVIWVRQHRMTTDGGSDSDVILEVGVTQGAESGSPVVPSVPTGALALARALVTTGAASTSGLTFTAMHNWTCMAGGVLPIRSSTERTALDPGLGCTIFYIPDLEVQVWNGSTWKQGTPGDSGWVSCTVSSPFAGTVDVRKVGSLVTARINITRPSGFSATATTAFNVPVGYRPTTAVGMPASNLTISVKGTIQTNGNFDVLMSGAAATSLNFGGVSWFVD